MGRRPHPLKAHPQFTPLTAGTPATVGIVAPGVVGSSNATWRRRLRRVGHHARKSVRLRGDDLPAIDDLAFSDLAKSVLIEQIVGDPVIYRAGNRPQFRRFQGRDGRLSARLPCRDKLLLRMQVKTGRFRSVQHIFRLRDFSCRPVNEAN